MSRGYKPQRASDRTDRSNIFSFNNDAVMRRHIPAPLLKKLSGKKAAPTPVNNFERARQYYEAQQQKTRSK